MSHPITGYCAGLLTAIILWGAVSTVWNAAFWCWMLWKVVRK
jgi:hypothetical protein